jgi:WD40 repeat protein
VIAFDGWKGGNVAPTRHEIPVVVPRSLSLKLEPVSSRLKGELIHPNKTASMGHVEFSPDGKYILAGDYPGGVIALWDIDSGKRLTTIEAGYGYHATARYYAVSPDWKTVFAWREKRKYERVEQDGKRMIRWTFGGEVRAWNLEDGKLLRTYKRQPQSNVRVMRLAPDGKTFYTFDELPGTYERQAKQALSLWDVKTGTYRTLTGLGSYGVFSPDGKILAIETTDENGYANAVKLIDIAAGREKMSIPIKEKAWVSVGGFSKDGKILFGTVRVSERPKQWKDWRSCMKWWDAATGEEVASFPCEKNESASIGSQSPDGKIAVALNWQGDKKRLLFFSVPEKRLLRTVVLCEKTEGQRSIASGLTFHPDGKWLAVITRTYPEKASGDDLDPRDVPQPRILLIETATGAIRETMIAPHGFSGSACFSPDGQTLATDGHGRVLLWDMTKMPK